MQNAFYTTEHAKISVLLRQLQKKKVHIAVVLDEYGGTLGIVTLEDILEELVGEIWDEHDQEEVLYGKVGEDEYWVDGKCELADFFTLYETDEDEDEPNKYDDEEYDSNTVGGLVTELYGEIPPIGEVVRYKDIDLKIVKATKQKVLKLRSKKAADILFEEEDKK